MALYVNTNTSSINAQRNLNKATNALQSSYTKLASGNRINSAKDDAAGLQISNRMTSQINGLTQGNRNANDGISLCQTAEGALDEVTNMLQRMRTLAVQAANGSNSSEDRSSLNKEAQQLQQEIMRIGTDTSFGGNLKIFGASGKADSLVASASGANGDVSLQVGSHQNQTIDISFKSMSTMLGTSLFTPAGGNSTTTSAATSTAATSTAGTATAGTATAGTATAGTATAGTSTAGTSTAGTSTAGTSTAGTSTAGTSTAVQQHLQMELIT